MNLRSRRSLVLATIGALSLGALTTGCSSGLELTTVRTAQNRPSNVAVYFKVRANSGPPVLGLSAEQFKIFEDDSLVSQYESKQTILNPQVAASHYTLLLVDMSGSISGSGAVDALVEAASAFADRVEKYQKVAIYAFDGSAQLHPIVPFTSSTGSAKAGVKQLSTYKSQDPSTNLNGAIVKGLEELDHALAHAEHPMHFGTLVVFTDGTDHASRVTGSEMLKKVSASPYDVFAIGLGAEIKPEELEAFGKNGTAMANDKNAVVAAFDSIGQRIEASTKSFYLLSYCSPARAGKHTVRIEATVKDEKGKSGERTGRLASQFDAAGFGPGCDPNSLPNFDVTKGDAVAIKPVEKKKGEAPKGASSPPAAAKPAPASADSPSPATPAAPEPAPPAPPPPAPDFNP